MSVSDVLKPDGSDYDAFLEAEVGEDRTGASVTVLSALARLGIEPWAEAKELARLGRENAEVRLNAHLVAITDMPALAMGRGTKAANLVLLLPKHAPPVFAKERQTGNAGIPQLSLFWILLALIGVAVVAWIQFLARTG